MTITLALPAISYFELPRSWFLIRRHAVKRIYLVHHDYGYLEL